MSVTIQEHGVGGLFRTLPGVVRGAGVRDNGDRYVVVDVDYTDWAKVQYGGDGLGLSIAVEMFREVEGVWKWVYHGGPQKIRDFLTNGNVGDTAKVSNRKLEVISFEEETIETKRDVFDMWVSY